MSKRTISLVQRVVVFHKQEGEEACRLLQVLAAVIEERDLAAFPANLMCEVVALIICAPWYHKY